MKQLELCNLVSRSYEVNSLPIMYLLHCSFYELSNDCKENFTLEQATKAHKGSRSIVLLFLYLGARWGGWSTPRPARFTPGDDPVPIV